MTTERKRPWYAKNGETYNLSDSSPWSNINNEDRTEEMATIVTTAEKGNTYGKNSVNQTARRMAGEGQSDQAINSTTQRVYKTTVSAIQWNYTGE